MSAAAEAVRRCEHSSRLAEGALNAIDTVGLEARLLKASQDPVFQEPDVAGPDVGAALEEQELAKRKKLHDCEGR